MALISVRLGLCLSHGHSGAERIRSVMQGSDVLVLTVRCKLINSVFQIFLKCLLASRLTLFRLSPIISFGSCNHSKFG
jgi:hypothetical protein